MASEVRSAWRGIPLIRSLKIWPKQILAGFILLLPFLVGLGWMTMQTHRQEIEPIDREAAASHLILDLQQLLNDLQIVRITSVTLASGDSRLANEVGEAEERAIEADLNAIDTSDSAIQQSLGTSASWPALRDLVHATLKASERMHASESVTRYAEVTDKVNEQIVAVTDKSLAQDPDMDVAACLQLILTAQDTQRRIGVTCELIASRGALRQNLNVDDTTELIRQITMIDHDAEAADATHRRAANRNPALRPHLEDGFNAYRGACSDFTGYLQNGVQANGGDLPASVHTHAVSALGGGAKLMGAIGSTLTFVLQARQDRERQASQSLLVYSAAALLVACIISLIIVSDITGPLQEVLRVTRAAAAGDLSVTVPAVQRGDEFGELIAALAAVTDTVRTVLQGVSGGVSTMTEATVQIIRLTRERSGPHTSGLTMTETMAALEEVTDGLKLNARRAEQVSSGAEEAARGSQAGLQATEKVFQETQKVWDSSKAVADTLRRLSEQVKQVSEISEAVNRLAEQANLVAYNTSVDAGKGEQTWGIAVVAQEVRKLTEQSQQATTRVRAVVAEIQALTAKASALSEEASRAGQEGLRLSADAGVAIGGLASQLADTSQVAGQIAALAQQQLASVERAAKAVATFQGNFSTNDNDMVELQNQAQRLYSLGQQLKTLADKPRA